METASLECSKSFYLTSTDCGGLTPGLNSEMDQVHMNVVFQLKVLWFIFNLWITVIFFQLCIVILLYSNDQETNLVPLQNVTERRKKKSLKLPLHFWIWWMLWVLALSFHPDCVIPVFGTWPQNFLSLFLCGLWLSWMSFDTELPISSAEMEERKSFRLVLYHMAKLKESSINNPQSKCGVLPQVLCLPL